MSLNPSTTDLDGIAVWHKFLKAPKSFQIVRKLYHLVLVNSGIGGWSLHHTITTLVGSLSTGTSKVRDLFADCWANCDLKRTSCWEQQIPIDFLGNAEHESEIPSEQSRSGTFVRVVVSVVFSSTTSSGWTMDVWCQVYHRCEMVEDNFSM